MQTTYRFTPEMAEEVSRDMWSNALKTHGSYTATPASEASNIGEMVRAIYVLNLWQRDGQGSPVRFLQNYAITEQTITQVIGQYFDGELQEEIVLTPTPKRANKYGAFEQWASEHVFEQFTTEQLVEQSGFSYPTTLKYIQESATFRKIKKGLWEIRDAKADREAEKKISS